MLCLCPLCYESAPCHRFCTHCRSALLSNQSVCQQCGDLVAQSQHFCSSCLAKSLPWERLSVVASFIEPWSSLIKKFKYQRQFSLINPMAQLLAERIQIHLTHQSQWQLVAMPMHSQRLKERGYNQAALLAQRLSQELGLNYQQPLWRHRETTALERLNRAERQQMVDQAFSCSPITGHWMLVDDVFTTGASMLAASKTLKTSGAQRIWLATLAKTPH